MLNASRIDNSPVALLEASAAGLVIISTRAGGIAETYTDGRNALLVEPGDWRGLAAAVDRVLGSPLFAQEIVNAAEIEIARASDWYGVSKPLYEAYAV